jgi:hypothetical protein
VFDEFLRTERSHGVSIPLKNSALYIVLVAQEILAKNDKVLKELTWGIPFRMKNRFESMKFFRNAYHTSTAKLDVHSI